LSRPRSLAAMARRIPSRSVLLMSLIQWSGIRRSLREPSREPLNPPGPGHSREPRLASQHEGHLKRRAVTSRRQQTRMEMACPITATDVISGTSSARWCTGARTGWSTGRSRREAGPLSIGGVA
jgi:hypothetical protein